MKPTDRRSFLESNGVVTAGPTLPSRRVRVARAQAKDPIKVGVLTPLKGAYAAEAADQQTGATLAVDEINGWGGLLGRKVELLVRDGQLKPGVGAQKMQEITAMPGWSPAPSTWPSARSTAPMPREPGLRNRPDLLQRFLGV